MSNERLKKMLMGLRIAALIAGGGSAGVAYGMNAEHMKTKAQQAEKQVQEMKKEGKKVQKEKKSEAEKKAEEAKEKAKRGMTACSGMSSCGGSSCGGSSCGGMMKKKSK